MKQSGFMFKLLSVLLALCLFLGSTVSHTVLTANGEEYNNYDNLSNEEKQAYLEQQIKELNEKLGSLEHKSKDTEEYIRALDEKIKYMRNQLKLAKEEMENSKNKISNLERQYTENEANISSLQIEIKDLLKENEKLKKEFDVSYEEYSKRARAMYISGNTSVLEALLTSSDISMLFTRLEMIKRVSSCDKILLKNLKEQGNELIAAQNELSDKKDSLTSNQQTLIKTKDTLKITVKNLEEQQVEFADKQKDYESEKSEADSLLLKIQKDTKAYSEYRHQNQDELDEINREIEAAADKYIQQLEEQTTTTTTTTQTETKESDRGKEENKPSATKPNTTKPKTTKPKTTKPSGVLSMTYPVPSQTRITTDYGSAGYAGHTGVDFACDSGSKVVAAESGIVIISKDLKNSDGTYRSYGRYIVIMHDKKNSAGNQVYTLYAHNSSRVVSEGQHVKKGQLIAYSGSTGNSTGPHCHFEVRTPTASYDDCVNPRNYLP